MLMKILVTGIGITGKSTFRRGLVRRLREVSLEVVQYDADEFTELRSLEDIDCKTPNGFKKDVLYIIEDIHGLETGGAYMRLEEYDLIAYLLPGRISHLMFWFSRCWKWFQFGQFSWEKGLGWKGTGKPYDYRNILPIIKAVIRDFKNREVWISNDLRAINHFPHLIVRPYWTPRGIRFSFF